MSEALSANEYDDQQDYHQKYVKNKMQFYSPVLQQELAQKPKRVGGYSLTAQLYSFEDSSDDPDKEEIGNQTPNLTGIPNDLKQRYEERSGFSFDDVRVHYNSDKPAKLQALAYAQGNQVYMGPGQEKHLEHELGHVVQQKQGIVRPTTVVEGLPVNDDLELESDASTFIDNGEKLEGINQSINGPVVQRLMSYEAFLEGTRHKSISGKRGMHNKSYYDDIDPILKDYEEIDEPNRIYSLTNLKSYVDKWKLERPDSKRQRVRQSLLESIETDLNALNNKLQRMNNEIPILVEELKIQISEKIANQGNEDTSYWKEIIDKFKVKENIEVIISKILSITPEAVDNPEDDNYYYKNIAQYLARDQKILVEPFSFSEQVITIFNNLTEPISETLHDIQYWMKANNAIKINEIILTDSDIHTRGIGVCIVDYDSIEGSKKLVLKPEDKSFEKAVYGKSPDSLASNFNSALDKGMLGEEQKDSPIGQLDIQTSENNGSTVEYFKHKTFKDMDDGEKEKINKKSVENLVAFSSILGLADLHYQNAVYSDPGYLFQLIDAEVGMKYILDSENPLATVRNKGEMLFKNTKSIDDTWKYSLTVEDNSQMSAFMSNVADRLKGKKVRIVLLETSVLFFLRYLYIRDMFDDRKDSYFDALKDAITDFYPRGIIKAEMMASKDDCITAALNDFQLGRIPYFELDLSNSILYQKTKDVKVEIAKFSSADGGKSFLDAMIEDRMNKLIVNKNSASEKGSQPPVRD